MIAAWLVATVLMWSAIIARGVARNRARGERRRDHAVP